MDFNEYQNQAVSTAIYPHDQNISYLALALCGEAGESVLRRLRTHRLQSGHDLPRLPDSWSESVTFIEEKSDFLKKVAENLTIKQKFTNFVMP